MPAIDGPVATDLVAAAELRPGERILDMACGTGIVARLAAERIGPDGRLAALDVNPGMIAVARHATPPPQAEPAAASTLHPKASQTPAGPVPR